jgi:hypothetical protein
MRYHQFEYDGCFSVGIHGSAALRRGHPFSAGLDDTDGFFAKASFGRPADRLHIADAAVGMDDELDDHLPLDLIVDRIVGVTERVVEKMNPGAVAAGVTGFDLDFGKRAVVLDAVFDAALGASAVRAGECSEKSDCDSEQKFHGDGFS